MNYKIIRVVGFFIAMAPGFLAAQFGSLLFPFTSVAQASGVSVAGLYYFNLSGNLFVTQVSDFGWVLIARDYGGAIASSLPQTTLLTNISRGILPQAALSNMSITAVGISSSDGFINVTTTNSSVISRVNTFKALNQGAPDNSMYGTPWVGSGAAYLNSQGANCNDVTTLDAVVYHPCGDASKFHWLPNTAQLAEIWSSGFISSTVSFNLWVQSSATVSPLPIELLNFEVSYNENISKVDVAWSTATETNNDFFTIERSADGQNFASISTVRSKAGNGNSQTVLNYEITDNNPLHGTSYYRLKQTDFNGNFTYFKILSLNSDNEAQNIFMYPNPVNSKSGLNINIIGHKDEQVFVSVKDIMGREFLSKSLYVEESNQVFTLSELAFLSPGTYIAMVSALGKTHSYKLVLH